MIEQINASNIAIVGGGRKCKVLLELLLSEDSEYKKLVIKGVADKKSRLLVFGMQRCAGYLPPLTIESF